MQENHTVQRGWWYWGSRVSGHHPQDPTASLFRLSASMGGKAASQGSWWTRNPNRPDS